ncbi:MAG: alpha/beta fold hydrolase [Beijerinckiaceae bacterium]|nr:alpha/beta fold hydrolase [Beijerinckiaceae bacterium]
MSTRLDWDTAGRDWPNRTASRFVNAGGLRWHVQIAGSGPTLLLLHGTGASTHSWRGLLPLLARQYCVIAPDLPGHGFTAAPPDRQMSLPGMGDALSALLAHLDAEPAIGVGHSAGAALLVRMCVDGLIAPRQLVSINGALLPFKAMTGPVFSVLAKMLALNPVVPWFFAFQASNGRLVDRLLDDTGSRIDAEGVELYRRLVSNQGHVSAALRMMANWDLTTIETDLPRLEANLHLLVGARDRTISPDQAYEVRKLKRDATITRVPGLGHLAHEESPAVFAEYVATLAAHAMAEA